MLEKQDDYETISNLYMDHLDNFDFDHFNVDRIDYNLWISFEIF